MTAVEGRLPALGELPSMPGQTASERFAVVSAESSLTFFATSSLQSAYGKTTELSGYIDAAWYPDGSLAKEPSPRMHLEFRVESLRTGNEMQDREMWKLIDSKRFPKIAGDLHEFTAGSARGRYVGAGQIVLAGLARRYESEFIVERHGRLIKLGGEVNVDVRDFGLKPMKLLVLSVAPLVRVRLHLVARRSD